MENGHDNTPKKFKYQAEMQRLSVPCPPTDFGPRETIAFRWVFENLEDERNFIPQFVKNPNRFNDKSETVQCAAVGLSVFDTAAHAKKQFATLFKYMRNDVYELGTNLALGTIQPVFGVMDFPNQKGHFTFHPFENIELKEHFQIVSTL